MVYPRTGGLSGIRMTNDVSCRLKGLNASVVLIWTGIWTESRSHDCKRVVEECTIVGRRVFPHRGNKFADSSSRFLDEWFIFIYIVLVCAVKRMLDNTEPNISLKGVLQSSSLCV